VVKCSVSPDDTQLEASKVISSLLNHAENIGANSIVLFPYAHLFEDLSEPEKALNLLDFLYDRILEEFQDAIRVPFGWYKEYTLHSHGHPLSAAAREF
jgi:threonyl-tRNA synthetase